MTIDLIKRLKPIEINRFGKYCAINIRDIKHSLVNIQRGVLTLDSRINEEIKINKNLKTVEQKKQPLSDLERQNLAKAYEHVNVLIQKQMLEPHDILDLNDICLYGTSLGSFKNSATIEHLLDVHGYQNIFYRHLHKTWNWLNTNIAKTDPKQYTSITEHVLHPYTLAAKLYTKIMNNSYLFTDGHQRTASLMMTYILAKYDIHYHLDDDNASEFFMITNVIKNAGKTKTLGIKFGEILQTKHITLKQQEEKLAYFLEKHSRFV